MFKITLQGLFARKLRLVTTALAVFSAWRSWPGHWC